jgi:DNA-binding transcriptional MerR regulator
MVLQTFTLAQLARAVGMSVEDVRFYRDSGLLPPPKRQRTRTDDFSFQVEHVERLRFIQRALAHGFTLEDIARFVDEHGLVTCNDVYRISLRRLEELRHTGDAKAANLKKLIASCSGKGGRKDCEILAALSEDDVGQQVDRPLAKPGLGDR